MSSNMTSSLNSTALLAVDDAINTMLSQVSALAQTEQVDLLHALDRVLAQDIISDINVPAYNNSAMDGFALRAADVAPGQTLTLAGEALAGHAFNGNVGSGCCVRIMTGAVMPAGLDTVVMQEHCQLNGDKLSLQQIPKTGEHVRYAGEDIAQGQQVLAQGQRLTAVDIGLLASLGIASVTVYRKLKVAVFSTGDELLLPGQPLPDGYIYDSNRYVMRAMLQRFGAEIIDLGLLPDAPALIETAFEQAMLQADVLITSAGVSVGTADYTRQTLEKLGQINFWKVAIKPGKPFAFGKLNNCWFFGLPGNPVAAVVTLDQLVQPVLKKLAGETSANAPTLTATSAGPLKKQPGRTDYQRGWYWQQDGRLMVKTLGSQSSGMLSSVANANCYIVLERDSSGVSAGDDVTILPFSPLLR